MEKKRCVKCKYEWLSRVDNPISCPNCKTREWEEKKSDDEVYLGEMF